ncbi:hypothetical protein F5148DRAFT_966004, partial [Russula earlei]
FLYNTMHATQKIGIYWKNILNYKECEYCTTCNVTESMEHILVHCNAMPTSTIWELAGELWPHNPQHWLILQIG